MCAARREVASDPRSPIRRGVAVVRRTSEADVESLGVPARLLLVAPQPILEDRGTPIAIGQVLHALSELGWTVDLLTYPLGHDPALPGLEVTRVGRWLGLRRVRIGISGAKVLLDALLVGRIAERLCRRRYACIHAVEEMAFPATVLGRLAGVPVLYDMHSSLPEQLADHRLMRLRAFRGLLQAMERWLVRRVDAVACSSGLEGLVAALAPGKPCEPWRFPGRRAEVPPATIARLREGLGLAADAQVVLYCGSFEAYQGLLPLLEAMVMVRRAEPSAVLVLVGARHAEDFKLGRRAALADAGAVRIVGRQPHREIAGYLAMAQVLISTRAHGRNAPSKIFEYMAAARPIVAIDCAAHRAVLDDDSALLVSGSPAILAGAIVDLLHDPRLASRLAGRAAQRAERDFTWPGFVEQVGRLHSAFAKPAANRGDLGSAGGGR